MRTRRRYAWELPDPIPDNGSLRPHVIASEDWPPHGPTRRARSSASQFVAGLIVGMAASTLVTAWAVHTHRWPDPASFARASAAPQVCPPAPVPAPPQTLAAAPTPPPASAMAATSVPAAASAHPSPEKARKKAKARTKSAALARSVDTSGTAGESTDAIERRAAQELGEDTSGPQAVGRSAPRATSTETTAHLEDQAAAELSTSLK